MPKEFCPSAKVKPCIHGVRSWTECDECTAPGASAYNWHFGHGTQWTPRKEQLRAEAARNPFGKPE